jgi:hypothetical protein
MKNRHGTILMMTILSISLLFFFAVLYAGFYSSEKSIALRAESQVKAQAAADAGVEDAIYQLKRNAAWNTGFSSTVLTHSGAAYSVSFDKGQTLIPYSTNNSQGSAALTGYAGRSVPAGMVHIVSVGKLANCARTHQALISTTSSIFQNAIATQQQIGINGNVTIDSFNSSQGTYQQSHQNSGGNLLTNAGGNDVVTLSGKVNVYGNISVGPGGTVASSIASSGNSTYQSASVATQLVNLPLINAPTGQNLGNVNSGSGTLNLAPGIYNNLNSTGGTIQLSAGTYVFSGEVNLSGQANIKLPTNNQPVKIFVLGDEISITGNTTINGNTQKPSLLTIYGGPDLASVEISGLGGQSQGLFFALYAPATDVEISGNVQLYGSVVSSELELNGGGGIHYDQALKTSSSAGVLTTTSRW